MYELNHKNLIDKCLSGDICLFTGSGFSLGGTIKSQPIFSTNVLIDSLLSEFIGLDNIEQLQRLKKKTFQQICQYAIIQKTEDAFNDFITEKFQNCIPSKFHYKYVEINWKDIFTTNVDDLVEEIYKKIKSEYNQLIQENNQMNMPEVIY
jgi:hypothetical protein